jgi:2-methylcitrate dehydratase PrpD
MPESTRPTGYTTELAHYVSELDLASVPDAARHAAKRALVNIVGCCVGGARHEIVETAIRALLPYGGAPTSGLLGRSEKTDPLSASFFNALSSAAYSFDDTHAQTILHPTGAVAAALLALAGQKPMRGGTFLLALIAGVEVAVRVSKAISVAPARGPIGWSQTGVAAGIGAAAAVAKAMQLNTRAIGWAIGHASQQASGLRVAHGTMSATMLFGNAAQAGVRSALLAQQGLEGPAAPLEGHYGFAELFASQPHLAYLTEGLLADFEVASLAYKPYPCGVVIHPAVDAAIAWHQSHRVSGDPIASVRVRLHPSALALGFRRHPANPLEAKVSLYHWIAVALAFGCAGLAEGQQSVIDDPQVIHLRDAIEAQPGEQLSSEAAELSIVCQSGRRADEAIQHCKGSVANPMTDVDLADKFRGQTGLLLNAAESSRLLDACWRIEQSSNVAELITLAQPS